MTEIKRICIETGKTPLMTCEHADGSALQVRHPDLARIIQECTDVRDVELDNIAVREEKARLEEEKRREQEEEIVVDDA